MGIVGVLFGAKLGYRGLPASIFVIRFFFFFVPSSPNFMEVQCYTDAVVF